MARGVRTAKRPWSDGYRKFKTTIVALDKQPVVKAGKLEIRPIEGSTRTSAVEVYIDGVKLVGVRRLQLSMGIDEISLLVVEQVLLTERIVEVQ